MSASLRSFIEQNVPLPKQGKKSKFGTASEHKIAGMVQDELGVSCACNDLTAEPLRGGKPTSSPFSRRPAGRPREGAARPALVSRSKVKLTSTGRTSHPVDRDPGQPRQGHQHVRDARAEWYPWHFPELVKIVNDNYMFSRLVMLIKRRDTLTDESVASIEAVVMDEGKAQAVLDAARHSMGMDISDVDLLNVHTFAERIIKLTEYRLALQEYLRSKLELVAPNLQALIGDQVAARLISHAGSLTNLAKYPPPPSRSSEQRRRSSARSRRAAARPSTLTRTLTLTRTRTRTRTHILALPSPSPSPSFHPHPHPHPPTRYGLIFHSSFIGRRGGEQGAISRYLANKCSLHAGSTTSRRRRRRASARSCASRWRSGYALRPGGRAERRRHEGGHGGAARRGRRRAGQEEEGEEGEEGGGGGGGGRGGQGGQGGRQEGRQEAAKERRGR